MNAAEERAAFVEALGEVIAAEEFARDARERAHIASARSHYADSEPLGSVHPYMDALALDMVGCARLRVDYQGHLVVPIMRRDAMVSSCRIYRDHEEIWPGMSLLDCATTLDRAQATVTIRCLSFLSGLVCFQASKNARVVVCWTAQNLRRSLERERGGLEVVTLDDWAAFRVSRLIERRARRYNGRPSEAQIRQAADEEIAGRLMAQAKFAPLAAAGYVA